MFKYIMRRLLMMIPVLLGVSLLIFTMLYITPGDPVDQLLGADATPEQVEAMHERLGMNGSFLERYTRYLWNLVRGDMGLSYTTKKPVFDELMQRFPTTLLFATLSTLVASLIGLTMGIISAVRQYSVMDSVGQLFALIGVSVPSFWLGLMLIIIFSVELKWLPSSGFRTPLHWILPSLTVGLVQSATLTRQTRSQMLEVIRQDYIKTAMSKGQTEIKTILKHALPNALIPIITVLGMMFGTGLGGAVITEQIYSIPGIGKLMVDAINARNYPVVQGGVLMIAFSTGFVNLLIDILYAFIDPRIKSLYGSSKKKAPNLRLVKKEI